MRMNQKKRTLIISLVVLTALPLVELAREEIVYLLVSQRLEKAYKQIAKGMTKEQVRSIAGEPDSRTINELGETWHWDAMYDQGWLWKQVGLTWVKGHYGFDIGYNAEGKVAQIWGGGN
jgi:hypothetical protein